MSLSRVIERRRVELHELHVLHCAFCPIYHGLAVAGGYYRVGGCLIYSAASSGTHHGHLAKICIHLLRVGVEHIGTVAVDVRCASCDARSQMVLCYYLHREMVFLYIYVGICSHGSHKSALYLGSSIVRVVQDSEFRVSALTVQVVRAVFLAVEVHTPVHKLLYLCRRVSYHLFYGRAVADVVAGYHCVLYVFFEVVHFKVCDRCHTSLRKRRIGFVECGFAYHAHLALLGSGHFQGVAHACHS